MTLHLDYETKSRVNLLTDGAYLYAMDPSTRVLMVGYAEDDDEPQIWLPGQPVPDVIKRYFHAGERRSIHCHNAQFERLISWYVFCPDEDVPEPPMSAFYCTAAQARARALPGKLEDLGRALGLERQKDRRGAALIKLFSIPDANGDFFEPEDRPDEWQEFQDYCLRDVEVERMSARFSHPLTEAEFDEYLVAERVNDRGIRVDLELAEAATGYAEAEKEEIGRELLALTEGEIRTPRQFAKLKEWVLERYPDAEQYMKRYRKGEKKMSLDSSARHDLLGDEAAPPEVLDLVDLVDEAGRSSVYKYQGMINRADLEDARVRGAYLFCGATQTQRFSSTGLQLHNFVRDTPADPEAARADIINRELPLGTVMDRLAEMLRPTLIAAPGNVLAGGDLSSIEAVVLPWLAGGDQDAINYVYQWAEVFSDPTVPDIYTRQASEILSRKLADIDKGTRQVGKVAVLSLGFGGGGRAFQAMARNYGIRVEFDFAEAIKLGWRDANKWAPRFWRKLETAAKRAVLRPGTTEEVGRVAYVMGDRDLYCRLPDGTVLSYPFARVEEVAKPWGPDTAVTCIKAGWKPAADAPEWPRIALYGGLQAENVTQATAARVFKAAMTDLDKAGWPVIGHTHDEVFLEVEEAEADDAQEAVREALTAPRAWASGLPLACETWSGRRYGK